MQMLPPPIPGTGRRCITLEYLLSFIVAVAAGVACHYIIKWLDGDK
nr:MAG TPA: cytochrome oxidase subunit [Bacteriophage sp.]